MCVYCRQPDSSAPNLVFGADHYRPKSVPRFAGLALAYNNLYYCCGVCNSRKRAYWPTDEKRDPYVVNPCDHEMAKHLWFDAKTGRVSPKSFHGTHTEDLLQLNDEARVSYRLNTLQALKNHTRTITWLEESVVVMAGKLKRGELTKDEYRTEVSEMAADIDRTRALVDALTGKTMLAPLPKRIRGVQVHP